MAGIELLNTTPFTAAWIPLIDEGGREIMTAIVKGAWRISAAGSLTLMEEQIPLEIAGTYRGEPGESSLIHEPETAFMKPATDVVLAGHAWPPEKGLSSFDVEFSIGPLTSSARIFGEREWGKRLGMERISPPEPITGPVELSYELAFGGWDRTNEDPDLHTFEARNPVGTGYRHRKYGKFVEGAPLPRIEHPKHLIKGSKDAPPPAGFGFIGPHWAPRSQYVGTYDETWRKNRMPLLPSDFDRRFFNAAHPDLIADGYLNGNESALITNVTPDGPIRFDLPGIPPPSVQLNDRDNGPEDIEMKLDTVIVNMDERTVQIIWRGYTDIHGRLHRIALLSIRNQEAIGRAH